jgi:hypothetical protein
MPPAAAAAVKPQPARETPRTGGLNPSLQRRRGGNRNVDEVGSVLSPAAYAAKQRVCWCGTSPPPLASFAHGGMAGSSRQ